LARPTPPDDLRIELIGREHPALPSYFESLPRESGWPAGTVLSLSDREPSDFEQADNYVAAFIGEELVGALSLHPPVQGNYHRLHNLHFHIDILPDWQGRGIGSALMPGMIAFAREREYWRIYLGTLSWNHRALALFGRFGFRIEGISRAAYRVKTEAGAEYYVDGIGMALWIGPELELDSAEGMWQPAASGEAVPAEGVVYRGDTGVEIDELIELYASVDDRRQFYPEMIKGAWTGADLAVTARRDGKLIGMARGITDRSTTLYICDVLVEPGEQKQGIGGELMRRLVAPYRDIYQTVLLTDPETIPFYEKLGYLRWESACLRMHPPE
jgi:GNAT superfamily N-acetyltransferase